MGKPLPKSKTTSMGTEKGIRPYWNEACQAISRQWWLPSATNVSDSALRLSVNLSCVTLEQSWFSAGLLRPHQVTNFCIVARHCIQSLLAQSTAVIETTLKSRKIRLYPTAKQRAIYRRWLGTSRYVYNRTLDYLEEMEGRRPAWTTVAKAVLATLPEWAKETPYQIKKIAVKDACEAFSTAKKKCKLTGETFSMKYRSRKSPSQSCFIPKSAVKAKGIYPTLSGGKLNYAEALPLKFADCRIQFYEGRWYLCVPFKTTVHQGETQARMVALDPGVRTFISFFSPDVAGVIGYHDFGRLVRLCQRLDQLLSRIAKSKDKNQRRRMRLAANRMRWRIRDLREELHAKAARFLVDHFDVILIPTFETSQMVRRGERRIRSKTVRAMLTWAHFKFKQRLKQVAFEAGKLVIEVNEAYTSKTCSWSGEVVQVGSREYIRGSDGVTMHRDLNGARGIFLRALAELPMLEALQRTLVSNADKESAFGS